MISCSLLFLFLNNTNQENLFKYRINPLSLNQEIRKDLEKIKRLLVFIKFLKFCKSLPNWIIRCNVYYYIYNDSLDICKNPNLFYIIFCIYKIHIFIIFHSSNLCLQLQFKAFHTHSSIPDWACTATFFNQCYGSGIFKETLIY